MAKNKIVAVEVNHTIDQMITFQKMWIKSLKMQRGMSAQELDALSICEDILKILECSKSIGTHQGFEDGYKQAIDDILKVLVTGYIEGRKQCLRDKICAIETSVLDDCSSFIKVKIDKKFVIAD